MKNMNITALEIGISTAVTTTASISAQLDPLWTALIGFGVSLVTMVGGEVVKWLVSYFKKKRVDIENTIKGEDKDEEGSNESTT